MIKLRPIDNNVERWKPLFFVIIGLGISLVSQSASLSKVNVSSDGLCLEYSDGTPFIPVGVNYFRPDTGWPPQLWKKFDPALIKADLTRLKADGYNCVRVFLTFGSFYDQIGVLNLDGINKFDQFLQIAEEVGIYVHPTGPDHWEGIPLWAKTDRISDDKILAALEEFWRLFVSRYKGRTVILGYDLLNEPTVGWKGSLLQKRWEDYLTKRYGSIKEAKRLLNIPADSDLIPGPTHNSCISNLWCNLFQEFREKLAVEWTSRQAQIIHKVDPTALVTVGLIQWSVPIVLPSNEHYSAFRAEKIAPFVDFLEIHFYPLAGGFYQYESKEAEHNQLAYLHAILSSFRGINKPLILGEFGWYGGGSLELEGRRYNYVSEEMQARWNSLVVTTSVGRVTGWLHWGVYDHPDANDVTKLIGLWKADGRPKEWGRVFSKLAQDLTAINKLKIKELHQKWLQLPTLSFDWYRAICDDGYRQSIFHKWSNLFYLPSYRDHPSL